MLKLQQVEANNHISRKKPYICDICDKQFKSLSKLARHYLMHTGQKPHECHACFKTFRQLVHLERHQLTHKLPFKYNICPQNFNKLIIFGRHQQLYSENYQDDIEQAERSRSDKKERNGHENLCSNYQTSLTMKDRYKEHWCMKSDHLHVTRRKNMYVYETCIKMFLSQSNLNRHLLIHTGQKLLKHYVCDKSFRQSTHLKIHQLMHTEESTLQCPLCQKGLQAKSKLLEHKNLHAPVQNFPSAIDRAKLHKNATLQTALERAQRDVETVTTYESQET